LKNTHLLRCAHRSSLRRTVTYASFLAISRALHLNVFDQPVKNYFFNNLLCIYPKMFLPTTNKNVTGKKLANFP
jgi:hypothetical protein